MNKYSKSILFSLFFVFAFISCATTSVKNNSFKYIHDPQENPSAMEDIIVNPDAVYGFSPNPDSKRLGEYASYDWTDSDFVATARQSRYEYFQTMKSMYETFVSMRNEGKSIEEIARKTSELRNTVRLESYKNDSEGLSKVKKSNLETYGNENGPTADFLFEKYKSWETVMLKSFSTNSGMDACTGFYDDNYDLYVTIGQIKE